MNDFYVGYAPKAPADLAEFVRRIVALVAAGILVAGLALVFAQMPFANSVFEFGNVRTFEGRVEARPYPVLVVSRPGTIPAGERDSRYLMVAPGKHGAHELVAGFDEQAVRLKGQLIARDGGTMLEVVPGSIESLKVEPALDTAPRDLGPVTLTGEIVDSKCYLGVMNPGSGKVHRDCAARCLSGGIPPIFATSDQGQQFLLVGTDGNAIAPDALREYVAEPITVSGELLQRGTSRLLRIDVKGLRHAPDGLQARFLR
jgi:hypothetical protein